MKANIDIYNQVKEDIDSLGFNVIDFDFDRPWGGFLVIDKKQRSLFISTFFNNINLSNDIELSLKIIIVNPKSRLSWQYHFRRKDAEVVGFIYLGSSQINANPKDTKDHPGGVWNLPPTLSKNQLSKNNIENSMDIHRMGDVITFDIQERHRLIGLDNIGVVAEIWQHIDIDNPSDENDIVRLQNDYKRK